MEVLASKPTASVKGEAVLTQLQLAGDINVLAVAQSIVNKALQTPAWYR